MNKGLEYLRIIVNILIPLVGILLLFLLLPKAFVYFLPFVLGWLIALIANPLVRFLEKKLKIKRKHGSAIIIILVIAVVVLLFYFIISKFVTEISTLIQSIPTIYDGAKSDYSSLTESLSRYYERLPVKTQSALDSVSANIGSYINTFIKSIGTPTAKAASSFAHSIPSVLIGTIVMFMASYFFVADRNRILEWYTKMVPKKWQDSLDLVLGDLKQVVGGYFIAQFKIMAVVYLIVVVGLAILRVDFVFLVALGIAVVDMLPFFGTGTILGPWAIIEILLGKYEFAIGLIILYLVTQLVRQVIQPKILGDSIGMNPLGALLCMYVGFKIAGVLGMILAVPIAMIVVNLFKSGIFDNLIQSVKMLVIKINQFRKYEDGEKK